MASTSVGAFSFEPMPDPDPIETIDAWQKWYKENMHQTPNGIPVMNDKEAKEMWIQKAQEHFADTLAEYQYELTGKDFYKAFYKAAYENMETARKEYETAKDLVDMLRYAPFSQD